MLLNEFIINCQNVFVDGKNYSEKHIIAYGRLLRNVLKIRKQEIDDLPVNDVSIAKINATIVCHIDSERAKLLKLHYGLEDGVYRTYHEIATYFNVPVRVIVNRINKTQRKLSMLINLFSKKYEERYNTDNILLLKLSSSSYLALLRAGIRTISELSALKEKDLTKIKYIGKVRAKEIIEKQKIFFEKQ